MIDIFMIVILVLTIAFVLRPFVDDARESMKRQKIRENREWANRFQYNNRTDREPKTVEFIVEDNENARK